MKYINAFQQVLVVIVILTCSPLLAQETSMPTTYVASPDIYQVLLENDEVLVLKMVLSFHVIFCKVNIAKMVK